MCQTALGARSQSKRTINRRDQVTPFRDDIYFYIMFVSSVTLTPFLGQFTTLRKTATFQFFGCFFHSAQIQLWRLIRASRHLNWRRTRLKPNCYFRLVCLLVTPVFSVDPGLPLWPSRLTLVNLWFRNTSIILDRLTAMTCCPYRVTVATSISIKRSFLLKRAISSACQTILFYSSKLRSLTSQCQSPTG